MFEHLHAGDHVEAAGMRVGVVLGGALHVFDLDAGFDQVQARDFERRGGHVDAGHRGEVIGERLGEHAALGKRVPLWLMTSDATDGPIREALKGREGLEHVAVLRQCVSLRLNAVELGKKIF